MAKPKRKDVLQIAEGLFVLNDNTTAVRMEADNESVTHTHSQPNPIPVEVSPNKSITVSPWTGNNNWPQHVLDALSKSHIGKRGLVELNNAIYGQGLHLISYVLEDGSRKINFLTEEENPQVYELLRRSLYKRDLAKAIRNYTTFRIVVTEYVLDGNRKNIYYVSCLDADICRFSTLNNEGFPDYVVYSAKWRESGTQPDLSKDKDFEAIPVMNPRFLGDIKAAKEWVKTISGKKFCVISVVDTLGRDYYNDADWHALIRNKTIFEPEKIASFRNALMDNQISVKTIITVAEDFFKIKYGESQWTDRTPEERQSLREELLKAIDSKLTGTTAAHKTLQLTGFMNEQGDLKKYITVEYLDTKSSDGAFIPERDSANNEILKGIGVNPAIIGHGATGSKQGPGSGSDIREAHTVNVTSQQFAHDTLTERYDFAFDFNGYRDSAGRRITCAFPTQSLTTLDVSKSGVQTAIPNVTTD